MIPCYDSVFPVWSCLVASFFGFVFCCCVFVCLCSLRRYSWELAELAALGSPEQTGEKLDPRYTAKPGAVGVGTIEFVVSRSPHQWCTRTHSLTSSFTHTLVTHCCSRRHRNAVRERLRTGIGSGHFECIWRWRAALSGQGRDFFQVKDFQRAVSVGKQKCKACSEVKRA